MYVILKYIYALNYDDKLTEGRRQFGSSRGLNEVRHLLSNQGCLSVNWGTFSMHTSMIYNVLCVLLFFASYDEKN